MAIEHADSFDIYGTSIPAMLDGVYAQAAFGFGGGPGTDPDGLSTQRVLSFNGGVLRYPLQTPAAIVGNCCRAWCYSLPNDAGAEPILFYWADIDNNDIAFLKVQTNGAIKLEVVGGSVYSTNFPVLTSEAWWHIECRIDVAAGEFELRVEGRKVLDLISLVFNHPIVYQCKSGGETSGVGATGQWAMKDYVIWNTLGTDNSDFLGPVRVMNLTPNLDEDLGGWLPTPAGNGFSILDNNPPNPAEYLSGPPSAIADPMVYGMANLPDDVTSVKAVVTYVHSRKIDGGYGQLQTSMIGTDGEVSPGVDRPITAGYVFWRDVHERDPGTDSPWTRVGVNNSKIQIDRTL